MGEENGMVSSDSIGIEDEPTDCSVPTETVKLSSIRKTTKAIPAAIKTRISKRKCELHFLQLELPKTWLRFCWHDPHRTPERERAHCSSGYSMLS